MLCHGGVTWMSFMRKFCRTLDLLDRRRWGRNVANAALCVYIRGEPHFSAERAVDSFSYMPLVRRRREDMRRAFLS